MYILIIISINKIKKFITYTKRPFTTIIVQQKIGFFLLNLAIRVHSFFYWFYPFSRESVTPTLADSLSAMGNLK